jgi:hypothetical protein
MIKILIRELEKHRNETTFRPYLLSADLFRDCGIEFIAAGNSYDFEWIGQASYSNKSMPLSESITGGLEYLEKITGDYWLFDGQDSASLIGSYDVFTQSKAQYLLKNTMYADSTEYSYPYCNGRNYWGLSINGWKISDWSRFDDVILSGTNWLSTIAPNWCNYQNASKDIDVFALFAFPAKENFEFTIKTSVDYDVHRSNCIDELKKLPRNITVATLVSGQKIPLQEYYSMMSRSKIVVAPFGYGEMAPRDIESAMIGAILVKPDMSHIKSFSNPYIPGETYVNVAWNFEDMNNKILSILAQWRQNQSKFVENLRMNYIEQYSPFRLVEYIYNLIKQSPGVESSAN